jgi:hypothetical protein
MMCDLNAKAGTDNSGLEKLMGQNGMGVRNESGNYLVDFCNARQFVIAGSIFKYKTCHKVTLVSPDGQTKDQIDQIIVQQQWKKSLCDV